MRHKVTFVVILTATIICMYITKATAGNHRLDEITVTAQKSEENPQDIPMSLDYFLIFSWKMQK